MHPFKHIYVISRSTMKLMVDMLAFLSIISIGNAFVEHIKAPCFIIIQNRYKEICHNKVAFRHCHIVYSVYKKYLFINI